MTLAGTGTTAEIQASQFGIPFFQHHMALKVLPGNLETPQGILTDPDSQPMLQRRQFVQQTVNLALTGGKTVCGLPLAILAEQAHRVAP